MSFLECKNTIEEGDIVILRTSASSERFVLMDSTAKSSTEFGMLDHNYLIGRQFNRRYAFGRGTILALQGNPVLWTRLLEHRTQILYDAQIAQIVVELDLQSGSVVIESGLGSGSLSHEIAKIINPSGHLYAFDFHIERCDKAKQEFSTHGLLSVATVICRDVIEAGFEINGIEELVVDAVFLDLPSPANAVKHVQKVLNGCGGRLGSFSPCIEQCQKLVSALSETNKFTDIRTSEILCHNMHVASHRIKDPFSGKCGPTQYSLARKPACTGHCGYLTFATYIA